MIRWGYLEGVSMMGDGEEREPGGTEGSPPPDFRKQPEPTAEDVAVSRAKREATAAHIREVRQKGQERIDRMFTDHLADHGEETEASAEDFLKETD